MVASTRPRALHLALNRREKTAQMHLERRQSVIQYSVRATSVDQVEALALFRQLLELPLKVGKAIAFL